MPAVVTCWVLRGLEGGETVPVGRRGATAATVAVEGGPLCVLGGTYVPLVVTLPLLDYSWTAHSVC